MPEPTPRMTQLLKLLAKEPNDPFLIYGLALEYKKTDDIPQALEYLDRAIAADSSYCYAYYQKGQIQGSQGDVAPARITLLAGIEAAKKKGDAHARSELETALAAIG